MAYLFKVPEGEAQGVDPGFFHQMVQTIHMSGINKPFYPVLRLAGNPENGQGQALIWVTAGEATLC